MNYFCISTFPFLLHYNSCSVLGFVFFFQFSSLCSFLFSHISSFLFSPPLLVLIFPTFLFFQFKYFVTIIPWCRLPLLQHGLFLVKILFTTKAIKSILQLMLTVCIVVVVFIWILLNLWIFNTVFFKEYRPCLYIVLLNCQYYHMIHYQTYYQIGTDIQKLELVI